MIIAHNQAALNAFNKLQRNNTSLSKSLGKLSSGLRIDKAADDAAGLAISEKMRAQIRGLQQSQRNAQDGISLIQTAEGGLAQIQDPPLQRLRELAIQASSDTLTNEDRKEIQKEAEQIKEGIDKIANNTHFNGINLLNQPEVIDLGEKVLSTTTSNTTTTKTSKVFPPKIDFSKNFTGDQLLDVTYESGRFVAVGRNGDIMFSDDGSNWTRATTNTGEVLNDVAYGDGTYVAIGQRGSIVTSVDNAETWNIQSSGLTNASDYFIESIEYHDSKFVALATNYGTGTDKILTSTDGITWDRIDDYNNIRQITWGNGQFVAVGGGGTYSSTDGVNWTMTSDSGISLVGDVAYVGDKFIAVGNKNKALISDDGLNWKTVDVASDNNVNLYDIAYNGKQLVVVGDSQTGADRAKLYTSLDGENWDYIEVEDGNLLSGVTWGDGKFVSVGFYRIDEGAVVDPTTMPEPPPTTTVDTQSSSLSQTEDNVTTNTTTSTITTTINSQIHTNDSITKEKEVIKNIITTTTTISHEYDINDLYNNLLQVGPNTGNTLSIELTDVRTSALGIEDIDLTTRKGAESSIITIDQALKEISAERGKYGAIHNRLEHTISYLDNATENLQSAESRIRDVDMAKEVMKQTKASILAQASQAMLAQANQQPQGVIQLLR
jgi:flagellin